MGNVSKLFSRLKEIHYNFNLDKLTMNISNQSNDHIILYFEKDSEIIFM